MLIKEAADRNEDISILMSFMSRTDLTPDVRKQIDRTIRNIRSGNKGEADAAYEIGFHYGQSNNWAVLHDVRLEHRGRVAQIDHLLINRFLEVWVIESKRFSEGIAINEHGECSMFWHGKAQGVGSPHEQNQKHIAVLEAVCDAGLIAVPKRLGIAIKPVFKSLVMVSTNARISRPSTDGWWTHGIIKADAIKARMESDGENASVLSLSRTIAPETLMKFAGEIAKQHVPAAFNWASKFGIAEAPGPALSESCEINETLMAGGAGGIAADVQHDTTPPKSEGASAKKSKLVCSACSCSVPFNVARFCWLNKARFDGNIFCLECQKRAQS